MPENDEMGDTLRAYGLVFSIAGIVILIVGVLGWLPIKRHPNWFPGLSLFFIGVIVFFSSRSKLARKIMQRIVDARNGSDKSD